MKERSTGIHRSTYYLPLLRRYTDALLRFQKTKPIRGRAEDKPKWHNNSPTPVIPLGRREDVDTYSMRKTEEGNIQIVNYRNVLLTFTPDNRIHITPRWMGIMESGMIERVLGIEAWLDRRKIGIKVNGERHVIEAGQTLVIDSEGEGDEVRYGVVEKETVYSYYVNRKASNIVRAQYSGFSQYLHGFLQLRKDMEKNEISISLMEIADCIGYDKSEHPVWALGNKPRTREVVWIPDTSKFRFIDDKPQGVYCLHKYELGVGNKQLVVGHIQRHWDVYQKQVKAFAEMVVNGQPEETRTDNYYRATLTLLGMSLGYMHRQPKEGEDATVAIPVSRVEKLWDDVVLKYHSDEMIEKRPLKPNQLPNDRYNRYVTIMPTQEQIDTVMKREESFSQTHDERT
jgi:hypothetical protein